MGSADAIWRQLEVAKWREIEQVGVFVRRFPRLLLRVAQLFVLHLQLNLVDL